MPDDDFIDRDNKGLKSFERETEFISGHVGFEDSIIFYDFKPQRRVLACNLDLEVSNSINIIFVQTNEIPCVDCIVRMVNERENS